MSALSCLNGGALWRASLNTKPKLLMNGTDDAFTAAAAFTQAVAQMPMPRASLAMKGADHFWLGLEAGLAAHIEAWVDSTFV